MFNYILENALKNIFKCLACMKKKKNHHNTKFKLAKGKHFRVYGLYKKNKKKKKISTQNLNLQGVAKVMVGIV